MFYLFIAHADTGVRYQILQLIGFRQTTQGELDRTHVSKLGGIAAQVEQDLPESNGITGNRFRQWKLVFDIELQSLLDRMGCQNRFNIGHELKWVDLDLFNVHLIGFNF